MAQIRAFIAIELPDEIKGGLRRLQSQLKPAGDNLVKWVNPDGIHLTLKFLGNVDMEKLPAISQAMGQAAGGTGALTVATTSIGAFPNWHGVRVVWVGLEGDIEKLATLQKRLEQALKPLGFAPEGRPFSPHITLGRVRENIGAAERRRLGEAIAGVRVEAYQRWVADSLSLMRSELKPSGAIYSRITTARLWLPKISDW